jgi:hypothetical protein
MDVQELARRLEEARAFEVTLGGITYRLQMPPRVHHGRAMDALREAFRMIEDGSQFPAAILAAVAPCVTGMVGGESADVCIGAAAGVEYEPLPESAEAARLVLGEKVEHVVQLAAELTRRMVERDAALKVDRKN